MTSFSHDGWNRPRRNRLRGFTAIEVTAVATIIAILALVLIPIMRTQVEEAKIVAARDDMWSIEKAQSLAFAYTGHYFRLQDLTRPTAELEGLDTAERAIELLKLPPAYWDRRLPENGEIALIESWKGPFASFQKTRTMEEVIGLSQDILTRGDHPSVSLQGGPILVLDEDEEDWISPTEGLQRARYPIDPWGSPYIFQGPGRISQVDFPPDFTNESNFSTAIIYSIGPDGVPGFSDGTDPNFFYRNSGVIGDPNSDDLVREF